MKVTKLNVRERQVKIEFLTQDDSNYILPFFTEFVRQYAGEFEITQVSCCRAMGKRPRSKLLGELALLYGPFGLLRLLARSAWARLMEATIPARKAGPAYSIAHLCRAYGIPCQQIRNPNEPQFLEEVRKRASDLIVSVACPYFLKEPILNLPPAGCINIHNAPLPKYKGMMPVFWQMYHGERKVGITVHYMAVKVDEGAAILQDEMEIRQGESLDGLMRRAKQHGAHCMAKVLRQIQNHSQTVLQLDNREESYFTFPTHDQIRQFRRRGLRAI